MKRMLFILALCLGSAGCLSYQQYTFKFDFNTGDVIKEYSDIRTQKGGGDEEYSPGKDWELLKARVGEDFGKEYDPDVIKPVRAELFQEGEVLSGRETFTVQSPKAFPSKVAILERLLADTDQDLEFLAIKGEIFLVSGNKNITSSSGKKIVTEKNCFIVWPQEAVVFDFSLPEGPSGGTSLLSFYLSEKEKASVPADQP